MTDTALPPASAPIPPARALPPLIRPLPGLALTGVIAAAAFQIHGLPGFGAFSPLILSIVIGMMLHNLAGTPAAAHDGVRFALRRLLRAGIVLLGLQLTLGQIAQVGVTGAAVIVTALGATFLFTSWLGRVLGVEAGLAQLIAAGTSICGASAVIATNAVTRAGDEDVAYAVACVTIFGSLSMLLYPPIGALLALGPRAYGLWTGASIHEVAQVVAAGYQHGQAAGDFATIAKLTRVAMLAPVVIVLARAARRGGRGSEGRSEGGGDTAGGPSKGTMPWFVLGFVLMVGVASAGVLPEALKAPSTTLTQVLLAMALAAMGLETDFGKLRAMGLRPLVLGAAAWAFIATLALALVFLSTWA